jgi:hypothetical protein
MLKGGFMKHIQSYGRAVPLGATVCLLIVVTACSSAVPTETPGVERLGQFILRERGPEVELVLGYKFASMSLGNEWLILEIAASSPPGGTGRIERENIYVRTPEGVRIPAATQAEFGRAYAGLRPAITQSNVARDPLDYFPPSREDCALQLFVAPGEGVAFDQVTVNERRACQGKLFFNVPGGIQPGRWIFGVELQETDIRIPFTLEAK